MLLGHVRLRLYETERQYLLDSGFLSDHLLGVLRSAPAGSGGQVVLDVPRDIVEQFRAAFTDRLAEVGFDTAYEPTAEGRILESLIDRFFIRGFGQAAPRRGEHS